ncbi:MAG: putative pyridoxal phosphate-dependent enzyme [Parcubacteria group bacterium Gr01-1014_70]|nr:MAG: putative pyridoxal phosphate-dependent enzyme [Parcubacteria group bacterium Gr01-1014_70]
MNIPQHEPSFDEAEANAVFSYMKSGGWLMEFKKTEELERLIADYVGAKHCVMTVNGTVSLWLALRALGVGRGDEVLVPNLTMIASPNAVVLTGASPILIDVDSETLCMDMRHAEQALTLRTKALMYVPFNGRSGDMDAVAAFCNEHGIFLLEDAAQALSSRYGGRHLGTFGSIGSFSFSVPKIVTTGQGGALVTHDEELYKRMRRLKDFGRDQGGADIHNDWGWNFKFTDLQAVVGIEQMKKLETRVMRKKEIYRQYHDALRNVSRITFLSTDLAETTPWFIDIYVDDPDALQTYLKAHSIGTRRIYPAVHTQKIYRTAYDDVSFPVSKRFAEQGLWLPSSSTLTDESIDYIANVIKEYYI